jgi:meiosis arrest female protein 1
VADGLNNIGVDVLHMNNSAKNAADDKLQEQIDKYVDTIYDVRSKCPHHDRDGQPVLCIITGDINFLKSVRNALSKDFHVVLIHGQNCSQNLKKLVEESYRFDDIIKTVENSVKAEDQLKERFSQYYQLIVLNLANL